MSHPNFCTNFFAAVFLKQLEYLLINFKRSFKCFLGHPKNFHKNNCVLDHFKQFTIEKSAQLSYRRELEGIWESRFIFFAAVTGSITKLNEFEFHHELAVKGQKAIGAITSKYCIHFAGDHLLRLFKAREETCTSFPFVCR